MMQHVSRKRRAGLGFAGMQRISHELVDGVMGDAFLEDAFWGREASHVRAFAEATDVYTDRRAYARLERRSRGICAIMCISHDLEKNVQRASSACRALRHLETSADLVKFGSDARLVTSSA